MAKPKTDALLTSARGLVTIMQVLLIIAIAGLCVGVAIGVIGHGAVVAKVAAEGAPPIAAWAITGLLVLIAAVLMMAERFLRRLRGIIDSVAEGDPFVPANADRLEQMGWLSLAMNLVAIPTGLLAAWLSSYATHVKTDIGFSFGGLILMLTLFILARVFRQGAAMRDELEGTV